MFSSFITTLLYFGIVIIICTKESNKNSWMKVSSYYKNAINNLLFYITIHELDKEKHLFDHNISKVSACPKCLSSYLRTK